MTLTFTLDLDKISALTLATLRETLMCADGANMADIIVRKDGVERRFEADWLKYLQET